MHENKGVKFITDAAVKEFKGENGKVRNKKCRISKSKINVIIHFTCFYSVLPRLQAVSIFFLVHQTKPMEQENDFWGLKARALHSLHP